MRGKHDSQQTDEAELRASELAGNLKFSFASSWAFGGEDWTPLPMVGGELGFWRRGLDSPADGGGRAGRIIWQDLGEPLHEGANRGGVFCQGGIGLDCRGQRALLGSGHLGQCPGLTTYVAMGSWTQGSHASAPPTCQMEIMFLSLKAALKTE